MPRYKRIVIHELAAVCIGSQRSCRCRVKRQLVTQNIAFFLPDSFQLRYCRIGFHQQTFLNNF
ncbi:hypothetical protein NGUA19_04253 [Salmonella enterica]|nr:hypothetical protein NGUA19_04253 [Salmonella enterica]